jgi:hypothetical protein
MPSGTGLAEDIKPAVVVSESGAITAATELTSYRQGFADLLDLASPPARVAVLPPGAPTAIGFARTGQALRDAMATLAGSGSLKAAATIAAAAAATLKGTGTLTATATVKPAVAETGKTKK